METSIMQLF